MDDGTDEKSKEKYKSGNKIILDEISSSCQENHTDLLKNSTHENYLNSDVQ